MTSKLELDEYRRYGRQMILEGFGLQGQLKLQSASVAVVGAGGLGCPAIQYLAAAGVGRIGVIDHDTVEKSNLQRQILHTEQTVGMSKAESAALFIKNLNSHVVVDIHNTALLPSNAMEILSPYDVILDCTDNAPTRYLLSDTAVALKKPLVSGAAQKYEGQLTVYNLGEQGPCYRCLFPTPPSRELVGTCEETGILGAVTGVIGNMQALEAIKIITGLHDGKATMLLFSALGNPQFRTIKLRTRQTTCAACGVEGEKTRSVAETDYVQWCGGPPINWQKTGLQVKDSSHRIRATDLKYILDAETSTRIIDVRPKMEFGICHLEGSSHVPLQSILANPEAFLADTPGPIYLVCRLGNDSQIAANALRSFANEGRTVQDLVGGLNAWAKDVDPGFPVY